MLLKSAFSHSEKALFRLKNPKPFITIELTPKGKIPRGTTIPATTRLRLVSNNNLPLEAIRKAAEIAKIEGIVELGSIAKGKRKLIVRDTVTGAEEEHLIPMNKRNIYLSRDFDLSIRRIYLRPTRNRRKSKNRQTS